MWEFSAPSSLVFYKSKTVLKTKVYLENNYKILSEEKITNEIQEKYNDLELKIENLNGNMFFNKELMYAIIKELEEQNQIVFDEDNLLFKLI